MRSAGSVRGPLLRKFHRIVGMTASIFLLWICVSGILLNHTSFLELARKPLPAFLTAWIYPDAIIRESNVHTSIGIFRQHGQTISLDDVVIGLCADSLTGAAEYGGELWIACSHQLHIFTLDGTLVESQDSTLGLPAPVEKVGLCGQVLCVRSGIVDHQFLAHSGIWEHAPEGIQPEELAIRKQPAISSEFGSTATWERLILEAHSGRIAGKTGESFINLASVFALLLTISGVWISLRQS